MASSKASGEGAEQRRAGAIGRCVPVRRCRKGTLIFTSPPSAMIELQVRGSQPPWADPGLKLGETGCMAAREAVPGLETLPRFLYVPFLGLTFGPVTEKAELQPFPRASATSIHSYLLQRPKAAIPGGNYSHHSPMTGERGALGSAVTCCSCTAGKSELEPRSESRSRCSWACRLCWTCPVMQGPSLAREWVLPQSLQAPARNWTCPRQDGATAWASPSLRLLGETPGPAPAAVSMLSAPTVPKRPVSLPSRRLQLTQGPFVLGLSLPFPHASQLSGHGR